MGHVINPLSHRIGYTRFWNTNWAVSATSKNINYSFLSNESVQLLAYAKKILSTFLQPLFRKGWLLLNIQFLRFSNLLTFILVNQIKFISNLYKLIQKGLSTMFSLKKVEFRVRLARAPFSQKGWRTRRLSQMLGYYPYYAYDKNSNVYVPNLHKVTKLDKYFLYLSTRLPRYNVESNDPNLITYWWSACLDLLRSKRTLFAQRRLVQKTKLRQKKIYKKVLAIELIKSVFATQWLFYIKSFLGLLLKHFISVKLPIEITFVCVTSNILSASFISKYLSIRLLQKFPIRKLMANLTKQLKLAQQNAFIQGFKVVCNGRFARRGRATHTWKMLGKLPRSTNDLYIDYSIMFPVLTNSICAVKVWLFKTVDNNKLLII